MWLLRVPEHITIATRGAAYYYKKKKEKKKKKKKKKEKKKRKKQKKKEEKKGEKKGNYNVIALGADEWFNKNVKIIDNEEFCKNPKNKHEKICQ